MMNLNARRLLTACLMMCTLSAQVQAGVVLGATRLIYSSDAKEVTLSLKNSEDKDPFLVQSVIEAAGGEKQNNFVVTPPLFMLKPGSENKLRVFLKTTTPLAADRETLYWLSVKAVPSTERQQQGNFVQFAVTSRIKVLYRPKALGAPDEESYKKITFSTRGDEVVMYNPTPFYMNIASVRAGSVSREGVTLAPRTSHAVGPKGRTVKEASVVFINDFGGESDPVTVPVT